jgi:hypothetical protein
MAGKVKKVAPPAMALTVPPAKPAATRRTTSVGPSSLPQTMARKVNRIATTAQPETDVTRAGTGSIS